MRELPVHLFTISYHFRFAAKGIKRLRLERNRLFKQFAGVRGSGPVWHPETSRIKS
jgi:hypothetical protein